MIPAAGSVTGPTAPSDVGLRRAQPLALGNGVGLGISRELIYTKLEGQEQAIRERMNDSTSAQLLESETRLALAALGLDPGLGLGLHTDTPKRDLLALDVLEPVRPQVENWLLSWIAREPLRNTVDYRRGIGSFPVIGLLDGNNCRFARQLSSRACRVEKRNKFSAL